MSKKKREEDYQVSALIKPLRGYTVKELLRKLKRRKGVSVREIVPGVLIFHGPETALRAVELIAHAEINVDHRLHPDFF